MPITPHAVPFLRRTLPVALAVLAGCSKLTGTDDANKLTPDQLDALAGQLAEAATNALGGTLATSGRGLALQPLPPASRLIYWSGTYRVNCTAGGRIEVSGTVSGNIDNNGSGALFMQMTETITDWNCIGGFVINGDPYISVTGTFTFLNGAPATQQTMHMGGGFKWGTAANKSCQLSLTTLFSQNGHGTVSGTACGEAVYETF